MSKLSWRKTAQFARMTERIEADLERTIEQTEEFFSVRDGELHFDMERAIAECNDKSIVGCYKLLLLFERAGYGMPDGATNPFDHPMWGKVDGKEVINFHLLPEDKQAEARQCFDEWLGVKR